MNSGDSNFFYANQSFFLYNVSFLVEMGYLTRMEIRNYIARPSQTAQNPSALRISKANSILIPQLSILAVDHSRRQSSS